jgi:Heparinase II/III-like protein
MQNDGRFVGPLALAWGESATTDGIEAALLDTAHCVSLPPASDRAVWALSTGSADQRTIEQIKRAAEHDAGRPWPQPAARAYARYFRDGDRDEYESAVRARQHRLTRAVVTAASTLDERWIDEVADGLVLMCEQSSWCWPAHDDTFRNRGAVLPGVDSPFLDLAAGEVVAQLGWAFRLLGDELDERYPGLRARVRHEASTRVFTPFLQRRDWHWLGLDGHVHNWNPWIHGNLLVAALLLIGDHDKHLTARLVSGAVEGIDRYVAALPLDGAVDEGFEYWWNGACRALEALEVLTHATAGALDASCVPQLRATLAFPAQMQIGGPWYLNLADSSARSPGDLPWHVLHRVAATFGDDTARRQAASHRRTGEPVATERAGLGRLLAALTDRGWVAAESTSPPLPRDVWLPSTQVRVARQSAGSTHGLYLAVKGGHNGENHNHNDVGSVVVALNGVPVVVDAGRPTYTAQTFGPDRYQIWTMQSQWHAVPEIGGTAQSSGPQFRARSVTTSEEGGIVTVRMDIAAAYARSDVRHWWRTATLDRSSDRVEIVDAWDLARSRDRQSSRVHFLLAGQLDDVSEDHVLIRALDGAGNILMSWEPSAGQPTLTVRRLGDPMLARVWGEQLTRLSLDLGEVAAGTMTVQLKEVQ